MADILSFDRASGANGRTDRRRSREVQSYSDDFWPEVSSGLWVTQQPNPANAPKRVFGEIALILGGCGLLVALVSIFVHGPSLQ